jgi:hypothetical protein
LESKRNQCRNPTLQPKKPYAIPLTRALALLDRLEQSILARAFRGELVHQDADEVSDVVAHVVADQDAPTTRRRKIRAVAA